MVFTWAAMRVGSSRLERSVFTMPQLQGFGSFAFPLYPGYLNGQSDFTAIHDDGALVITSPNVKHIVQQHFQCMDMDGAEFEDDGLTGTVNSHWEERIFQVCDCLLHPSQHRRTMNTRLVDVLCTCGPHPDTLSRYDGTWSAPSTGLGHRATPGVSNVGHG